jgi:hypothetical protein
VQPEISTQLVREYAAKIGVGGFVTSRSSTKRFGTPGTGDDMNRMLFELDVDKVGGNKVWVHPDTATVDGRGNIQLAVSLGDSEAIAVKENNVKSIMEGKLAAQRMLSASQESMARPGTRGNANYGWGLPDTRPLRQSSIPGARQNPSPNVTGFDKELGRRPQDGQMSHQSTLDRVKELAEKHRQRGS